MRPEFALLPESIQKKAVVRFGVTAWRIEDVEETIQAARNAELAFCGIDVLFHFADEICEAYWLDIRDVDRLHDESWHEFVNRSADRMLSDFRRLVEDETNFSYLEFETKKGTFRPQGINPLDHLVFGFDFYTCDGWEELERGAAELKRQGLISGSSRPDDLDRLPDRVHGKVRRYIIIAAVTALIWTLYLLLFARL